MESPEPAPRARPGRDGWDRVAAALLLLMGTAHAALGVGGIANLAAFEANVREIEDAVPGGLYASLTVWGALMLFLGAGELMAARALFAGSPKGWLAGQLSALCGLGGTFFTLAIFRVPALVTIPLGLAVIYILAHRSSRAP